MRFRRLSQFSVRGILDAIKALQEAVESLQPRKSAGTLITHSSSGVTVRAARQKATGGGGTTSSSQPSRWQ
tara:strand:+ start:754 stop:966 length:213 start_codon:yes stop_codon:yes gene_type:complete